MWGSFIPLRISDRVLEEKQNIVVSNLNFIQKEILGRFGTIIPGKHYLQRWHLWKMQYIRQRKRLSNSTMVWFFIFIACIYICMYTYCMSICICMYIHVYVKTKGQPRCYSLWPGQLFLRPGSLGKIVSSGITSMHHQDWHFTKMLRIEMPIVIFPQQALCKLSYMFPSTIVHYNVSKIITVQWEK